MPVDYLQRDRRCFSHRRQENPQHVRKRSDHESSADGEHGEECSSEGVVSMSPGESHRVVKHAQVREDCHQEGQDDQEGSQEHD